MWLSIYSILVNICTKLNTMKKESNALSYLIKKLCTNVNKNKIKLSIYVFHIIVKKYAITIVNYISITCTKLNICCTSNILVLKFI